MKKLVASTSIIVLALAATISGTIAFFTDTETSAGNIITTGGFNLKVDNTSYYNGVFSTSTSWEPTSLTNQLFLNFTDVKPGDEGEDTISLHVSTSSAWACMSLDMTSNVDGTCTSAELESVEDADCDEASTSTFNGELAENVSIILWGDDGDNVLENDETIFWNPSAIEDISGSGWIPLADFEHNIWSSATGTPLVSTSTYYIGKAWCFGSLTYNPTLQDNSTSTINPTGVPGNIVCNGELVGNAPQTDSLTADVKFYATQGANEEFLCSDLD